jgi:hypothetical protein
LNPKTLLHPHECSSTRRPLVTIEAEPKVLSEMERSRLPPGMAYFVAARGGKNLTAGQYRSTVLLITFLSYMMYHASRKPPSIVKSVLNPTSEQRELGEQGWAPFNGPDGNKMLGQTDLAFLGKVVATHSLTPGCQIGLYTGHTGRLSVGIFDLIRPPKVVHSRVCEIGYIDSLTWCLISWLSSAGCVLTQDNNVPRGNPTCGGVLHRHVLQRPPRVGIWFRGPYRPSSTGGLTSSIGVLTIYALPC